MVLINIDEQMKLFSVVEYVRKWVCLSLAVRIRGIRVVNAMKKVNVYLLVYLMRSNSSLRSFTSWTNFVTFPCVLIEEKQFLRHQQFK